MKQLWNALIARLVWILTPRPKPDPLPDEVLKPGICECDHARSSHVGGKGQCTVEYPPDEEWPRGAKCACEIFILDDDDDEGDDEPETPSPSELEKMLQL